MAGSPTLGKISTGIRCTANTADRAMAISPTTTVIGRPRAAKTKRMGHSSTSLTGVEHERLKVTGRAGDAEQSPPDTQTGQRIIDLGLGQEPLGFSDLVDIAKP